MADTPVTLLERMPQPPTTGGLRAAATDTTLARDTLADENILGAALDAGGMATVSPVQAPAEWRFGFKWRPLCPTGLRTDGLDETDLRPIPAEPEDWREFRPYLINAGATFRAMDATGRALAVLRATAALEAITDHEMSAELWAGAKAKAQALANPGDPWPNLWLAKAGASTELVAGAISAENALPLLNDALTTGDRATDTPYGGAGMIHVTPKLLQVWKRLGHLETRGDLHLTVNGHRIVAAPGYDGTHDGVALAAGTEWAYATDQILFKLTAPERPDESGLRPNTQTNRQVAWAQRYAAAYWDACRWYRLLVTVPEG